MDFYSEDEYGREPLLRDPLARGQQPFRPRYDEGFDDYPDQRRVIQEPYERLGLFHKLYTVLSSFLFAPHFQKYYVILLDHGLVVRIYDAFV